MLAIMVLGLFFFREVIFTVSTKQPVKVNKVSLVPIRSWFYCQEMQYLCQESGLRLSANGKCLAGKVLRRGRSWRWVFWRAMRTYFVRILRIFLGHFSIRGPLGLGVWSEVSGPKKEALAAMVCADYKRVSYEGARG